MTLPANSDPPSPLDGPLEVVEGSDGQVTLVLPSVIAAVPAAREWVRERWHDLPADVLADVELVVSELVGNAVRHGSPVVRLRLRAQPFAVDVTVLDNGSVMPSRQVRPAGGEAASGRGLAIVDALASQWGIESLPGEPGKAVWAVVDRS